MPHTSVQTDLRAAAAGSLHVDPHMAAEQVAERIAESLDGAAPDLLVAFASGDHAGSLEPVSDRLREILGPGALMGVSAESVVIGAREHERETALSVFAASMPGTTISPFTYQQMPHVTEDDDSTLRALSELIHAGPETRGVLFFADPFSVPPAPAVEALSNTPRVTDGLETLPILGGMASSGAAPGQNLLVLNDHVSRTGGVGASISGEVALDAVVSQGCRPIGRPVVVTACRRNIIQKLGGKSAVEAARDALESIPDEDKPLLSRGMFIGRVINEYRDRFGRGDFLIRAVMGLDQQSGAIAIGDSISVGQTVQFHIRDGRTASEDLQMLLDAQSLRTPPVGAMLFTCNGRGSRLFDAPSHDAAMLGRSLSPPAGPDLPVAGFFATGEIGPIGGRSFLHGHTASALLLRPRTS